MPKTKWNWTIDRKIRVDRLGSFEDFKAQWLSHRLCLDIWLVTGITPLDIMGSGRTKNIPRARALVCWLLREPFDFTFEAIARAIGRDHSTVIAACHRAERAIEIPGSWERLLLTDICAEPWRDICP